VCHELPLFSIVSHVRVRDGVYPFYRAITCICRRCSRRFTARPSLRPSSRGGFQPAAEGGVRITCEGCLLSVVVPRETINVSPRLSRATL
jgi:hypothetical protein